MTLVARVVSVLLLSAHLSACGPTEGEVKKQAEEARLQKTRNLLSGMVSRHRASLDWDKQTRDNAFAFSIDVQNAIAVAAKAGQRIVVFGTLRDVYSKGDKRYVVAEYDSFIEVIFVLESPKTLLRSIVSLEDPKYGRFAFIVNPTSTAVPLLRALTEFENEQILIESAEAVVVQGYLVDFLELKGLTAEELSPNPDPQADG